MKKLHTHTITGYGGRADDSGATSRLQGRLADGAVLKQYATNLVNENSVRLTEIQTRSLKKVFITIGLERFSIVYISL